MWVVGRNGVDRGSFRVVPIDTHTHTDPEISKQSIQQEKDECVRYNRCSNATMGFFFHLTCHRFPASGCSGVCVCDKGQDRVTTGTTTTNETNNVPLLLLLSLLLVLTDVASTMIVYNFIFIRYIVCYEL